MFITLINTSPEIVERICKVITINKIKNACIKHGIPVSNDCKDLCLILQHNTVYLAKLIAPPQFEILLTLSDYNVNLIPPEGWELYKNYLNRVRNTKNNDL